MSRARRGEVGRLGWMEGLMRLRRRQLALSTALTRWQRLGRGLLRRRVSLRLPSFVRGCVLEEVGDVHGGGRRKAARLRIGLTAR